MKIDDPELMAALAEAEEIQKEVASVQIALAALEKSLSNTADAFFNNAGKIGQAVSSYGANGAAVAGAALGAGLFVKFVAPSILAWKENRDLERILPKKQEIAGAKSELIAALLPQLEKIGAKLQTLVAKSVADPVDAGSLDRFDPMYRGLASGATAWIRIRIALAMCAWAKREFAAWLAGKHTSGAEYPNADALISQLYIELIEMVPVSAYTRTLGSSIPLGVVYVLNIEEPSEAIRSNPRYKRAARIFASRRLRSWLLLFGERALQERELQDRSLSEAPGITSRAWATVGIVLLPIALGGISMAAYRSRSVSNPPPENSPAPVPTATRDCVDAPSCFLSAVDLLDEPEETSKRIARQRLERACDARHISACEMLAGLQCRGVGGAQDVVGAAASYSRACSLGASAQCSRRCEGSPGSVTPTPSAAQAVPSPAPMPMPQVAARESDDPRPEVVAENLRPVRFAASSAMRGHPAAHAFDGNPRTAWNESNDGPGDGEWIEARFARPVRLTTISIVPGWDYLSSVDGDLFPLNSHLRTFEIRFDGRSPRRISVAENQRNVAVTDIDVIAQSVRFEAIDVYPGARWQDLCISEISFNGLPVR